MQEKLISIVGFLETVGQGGMSGWAAFSEFSPREIFVQVFLGEIKIASKKVDISRPDVSRAIGYSCNAGFDVRFSEDQVFHEARTYLLEEVQKRGKRDLIPMTVTCVSQPDVTEDNLALALFFPKDFVFERTAKQWCSFFDIDLDAEQLYSPEGGPGGAITPVTGFENDPSPKYIAFYLPQYHSFAENDEWWGPGFTEWTGVVSLSKQFEEHVAPNVPADLGFYDLRLREVRDAQEQLAKAYGIYGFCYYYYWFSKKRIMNEVLDRILREKSPNLPFCLCWANEPWSRRWDGSEQEVLMEQRHDADVDSEILKDLLPFFLDSRYIRVNNKPLLIVYRLGLMPDPIGFVEKIQKEARRSGLDGLYICSVMSFGDLDQRDAGVDAVVEFPPHNTAAKTYDRSKLHIPAGFSGNVFDYKDLVATYVSRAEYDFPYFPGVMPRWDNTARKGAAGTVYHGSSPALFEYWLTSASRRALSLNPSVPFVFINSWNEWGEGAHLEPDRRFGRGYLSSVKQSLINVSLGNAAANSDVSNFRGALGLRSENYWLASRLQEMSFMLAAPSIYAGDPEPPKNILLSDNRGACNIDNCNGVVNPKLVYTTNSKGLLISGWVVSGLLTEQGDEFLFLRLISDVAAKNYFSPVLEQHARNDVIDYFGLNGVSPNVGFRLSLNLGGVERGVYSVQFLVSRENLVSSVSSTCKIAVY